MNEEINIGDTVRIHFHNAQYTLGEAIVLYKPVATGDSWRFKMIKRYSVSHEIPDDIIYISEGFTMELMVRKQTLADELKGGK